MPTEDKNSIAIARFVKVMRKSPPLAIVGAGVSVAAGYPTWNKLLDEIHQKLVELPIAESPKYLLQLKRMTYDTLWRCEEYRRLLGETGFRSVLWETFKPKSVPLAPMVTELVRLKFRHYLTTNYDGTLETAIRS